MLSLKKEKDFNWVFRQGKMTKRHRLSLRFVLAPNGETRAGIIISTAVSKKAVVRNRLKRQIREILREAFRGTVRKSWLVVVVFPGAHEATREEIKKELLSLCAKAGIIQ